MITTIEELVQAIDQMGRMQKLLDSYRQDILPKSPRNFAVFAEGPLDQIRQLTAQIDVYYANFEAANLQPAPAGQSA